MAARLLARAVGVVGLVGAAALAGAGAASAGQPNWSMTVVNLPSLAAAGNEAGFQVTISNGGPSNISKLFLQTDTAVAPDYVATTQGTCSAPGSQLSCSFGALRKGTSVTVIAAFPTSGGDTSFDPGFFATTSGATGNDKGNSSHGDTLRDPGEMATELTDSPDFGGGFVIGEDPVVTDDDSLNSDNVQSTKVKPPISNVVTTVEDGAGLNFPCPTTTCFGEWSNVTVGHGQTFLDDQGNPILFPVTLTMLASQVHAPSIGSIKLAHVLDDGTTDILSTRCGSTPTLNCITVSAAAGGKLVITAWVDQNGHLRGVT
jgi:hypothetical protein